MKINLSLNKKEEKKKEEKKEKEKERKNIEDVFNVSDNEEEDEFVFESNQNKKIEELRQHKLQNELKEFIDEHEKGTTNNEREKDKEKPRKMIQYLGYKGDELTRLKNKGNQIVGIKMGCLPKEEKAKAEKEHGKNEKSRREKRSSRNIERNNDKNDDGDDDIYGETSFSYKRKQDMDISIQDIFENKEPVINNPQSKYMSSLVNAAKKRKIEKEMLIQKKLQIHTEKEEKVFITKAYREKMKDRELIKQELLKEEKEREQLNSTSRKYNLGLFYKNINAPVHYRNKKERKTLQEDSDFSGN